MKNFQKGVGAIELLISVAILSIIAIAVLPLLYKFKNHQVLVNTTEDIVTLLNKARMDTLASKNSNSYGVHFEADRVVLFTGTVFNNDDANNYIVDLDDAVSVKTNGGINISGGGNDILFIRLTGDTDQNGTIVVQLNSDNTQNKIITIKKTGIIYSN